ncbi:MAG: MotE family protein [Aquificaceae bacterium]|jgi:flagellar motility protein MotE (MotC chaperone)|uniref:MotE family protein n=1 Tax=Hydrogenobacter sp. Uz 6-8 TaxID=3384828 RepID=UPI003094B05A
MVKVLLSALLFFSFAFPQSALQKKLKEEREKKARDELSAISKDLEEKLRKIEEERKKLEELKRAPAPKEEQRPEVKKLVDIFNKASPDEAGAIMNNLDPNLAAEILLNLRERQAAAILEAMDPQKAAEVSRIVMEKRGKR